MPELEIKHFPLLVLIGITQNKKYIDTDLDYFCLIKIYKNILSIGPY